MAVRRGVRLDADGVVEAGGSVEREGGHVGVSIGERVEAVVHGAPGQRALPPVRVLVATQRLRAEELPLAVVAREHPRRLPRPRRRRRRLRAPAAVAVGGARLRGGGGGEREVEGERRAGGGRVGRRLAADVGQGQLIVTWLLLPQEAVAALHA